MGTITRADGRCQEKTRISPAVDVRRAPHPFQGRRADSHKANVGGVGCARAGAAVAILAPCFRQVQVAGQHATERIGRVIVGIQQVLAHHTVIDFTALTTVLTMHAWALVATFWMARCIDYTDSLLAIVFVCHQLLQCVIGTLVVPTKESQKLLERAYRNVCSQGNRLNTLAFYVSQQAQDVLPPILECLFSLEVTSKLLQQFNQRRFKRCNLFAGHS